MPNVDRLWSRKVKILKSSLEISSITSTHKESDKSEGMSDRDHYAPRVFKTYGTANHCL